MVAPTQQDANNQNSNLLETYIAENKGILDIKHLFYYVVCMWISQIEYI